jgi:4-hydroxy-3-polyprenylbenzoate decarboxylase
MEKKYRIIIGITGASGSLYARLLAGRLAAFEEVRVSVIVTDNGLKVMRYEDDDRWLRDERLTVYDNGDLFAVPASGSARFDAMVIVPASMGTVGRLAAGLGNDLLARAADVMLKERRRLIVCPREAPYGTIHLRNMTTLSECGAIVCPLSPSFYSRPDGIEALCGTVVDRICALLGLPVEGAFEWGRER